MTLRNRQVLFGCFHTQGITKQFWNEKRKISRKGLSSIIVIGETVQILCLLIDVIVLGSSTFHLFRKTIFRRNKHDNIRLLKS